MTSCLGHNLNFQVRILLVCTPQKLNSAKLKKKIILDFAGGLLVLLPLEMNDCHCNKNWAWKV